MALPQRERLGRWPCAKGKDCVANSSHNRQPFHKGKDSVANSSHNISWDLQYGSPPFSLPGCVRVCEKRKKSAKTTKPTRVTIFAENCDTAHLDYDVNSCHNRAISATDGVCQQPFHKGKDYDVNACRNIL